MNTAKHGYSRKGAKTRRRKTFCSSAPLRLCAVIVLLGSAGCTPKEMKQIPDDRLTVEYSIDRDTIHIGDPVELVVTAWFPTNSVFELPEIGREKDIVLLNRDWNQETLESGLVHSETRYSITSFRLGKHLVSTNSIQCSIDREACSTNFPSITLMVESALDDSASTELADIKPMHKLPGRAPRWLWITLLIAVSAFLIGLLTSKALKNRSKEKPAAPPVPPHLIAFKALQALKNKALLEKDECKPFYSELSLILRTYLEGRFSLNAPDETTEEIVEGMSQSPELNGTQRNILQDFMRQADMVKFAKGHPDRTTMESAFDTTQRFVEETKNPTDPPDRSNQTDLNR